MEQNFLTFKEIKNDENLSILNNPIIIKQIDFFNDSEIFQPTIKLQTRLDLPELIDWVISYFYIIETKYSSN